MWFTWSGLWGERPRGWGHREEETPAAKKVKSFSPSPIHPLRYSFITLVQPGRGEGRASEKQNTASWFPATERNFSQVLEDIVLSNGGNLQSGVRCSVSKPVRWECLQRPGLPPSTWWVGVWSKDLEKKKSASCSDQLGPTCLQVWPLWLGFHWRNRLRSWWRSPWIGNDYYE